MSEASSSGLVTKSRKAISTIASRLRPESPLSDVSSTPIFDASDYSFGGDSHIEDENNNVHVGEFLSRFRDHGSESLCNAYEASRAHHTSFNTGSVTTTLCEDIFSLVDLQLNALHDYLEGLGLLRTETGNDILLDGLSFLFRNLWYKQRQFRDTFLTDLKSSCAAANDFLRMVESTESLFDQLKRRYPHLKWEEAEKHDSPMAALSLKISELLCRYSGDAVFAAQRVHIFLSQTVNRSSIKAELFGRDWEENLTHNQVALSLVKTVEDYLSDTQQFLCNDFLCVKAIDALVKATVCFYVQCLVQKADCIRHRLRNFSSQDGRLPFKSPTRALSRIMYDIEIIQGYFKDLAKESQALMRLVEHELSVLVAIHEFLGIAVGQFDEKSLEHFIIVLHKRTGGNVMVTTYFLGDLWFLVAPAKEKKSIYKTVETMKTELEVMTKHIKETKQPAQSSYHDQSTGLCLGETLRDIYEERRIQETTLCGQVMRSMNETTPETREETAKTENKARGDVPKRTPSNGNDWLEITDNDYESKEPSPSTNKVEEFGKFLQEKLLELLQIGNSRHF